MLTLQDTAQSRELVKYSPNGAVQTMTQQQHATQLLLRQQSCGIICQCR